MFGKIFIFISITILMIFLSSLVHAPWIESLKKPSRGERHSCPDWIMFYGFFPNDPITNRDLAIARTFKFDHRASVWAVGYAYLLSNRPVEDAITPLVFCNYHHQSLNKLPFESLRKSQKTCFGWITFYGFDETDKKILFQQVQQRNTEYDLFMAIWAQGYVQSLPNNYKNGVNQPSVYCKNLGLNTYPQPLPFVSRAIKAINQDKAYEYQTEEWIRQIDNIHN